MSARQSSVFEYQEIPRPGLTFCLPPGNMSTIQGVRIVVRYLETHPEHLHRPGDGELFAVRREGQVHRTDLLSEPDRVSDVMIRGVDQSDVRALPADAELDCLHTELLSGGTPDAT